METPIRKAGLAAVGAVDAAAEAARDAAGTVTDRVEEARD